MSEMTVSEAGRRGGNEVKKRYGVAFYAKIGQLGGEAIAKVPGHHGRIGKLGGEAVKAKRGAEYYAEIGRKGGAATRKRGSEYYARIGKVGGARKYGRGGAQGMQ